jgi:hypothetical protein
VSTVAWSLDGHLALSGDDDNTIRQWKLEWEFELTPPADWDERARPFLTSFLTLYSSTPNGPTPTAKPRWVEENFRHLIDRLGRAGFGWLRPEGIRRKLEAMAATWTGPPSLG